MKKVKLQKEDRAYCIGVYLRWTGDAFEIDQLEDDIYFDGQVVQFDDSGENPFVEIETSGQTLNRTLIED